MIPIFLRAMAAARLATLVVLAGASAQATSGAAPAAPPRIARPALPVRLDPAAADSVRRAVEKDRADTEQWLRSDSTSYLATVQRRDFGDKTALTVGREPGNDVRIDDPTIEPHHLLMMRDDARLLGRRPRARDDDSGRVRAARAQRRNEPVAGGIPPDDAAHRRAAAERRDVTHYVARAARPRVLVGHLDDGHRRLGRDAPHGAPDELVEHQVADDERTDASELPDEVDEPSRADAFHGSPR